MTGVERRVRGRTWPPRRALVLCASPRVGSTLLCDLLTVTGVLGHPKEVFFPAAEQACATAWGVPDPEGDYGPYLRRAITDGTAPNGVFATKVMWRDLARLRHKLAEPTSRAVLEDVGSSVTKVVAVHLRRRDALGAAISELRAEATGEWSTTGTPTDPGAGVDWERLEHLHRAQHRAERGWAKLLRATGIPTLSLEYARWTGDLAGTVQAVADLVGVDLPNVEARSPLRMQRDGWNERVRRARLERVGPCAACTPTWTGPSH